MGRIRSVGVAAFASVAVVMWLVVPSASAQTGYPPGSCTPLNGSQFAGNASVGQTFTVRATPTCVFTAGAAVAVVVNGVSVPGKVAAADGSVSVTVTVVSTTQLSIDDPVLTPAFCGLNTITATGPSAVAGGQSVTQTVTFNVVCPNGNNGNGDINICNAGSGGSGGQGTGIGGNGSGAGGVTIGATTGAGGLGVGGSGTGSGGGGGSGGDACNVNLGGGTTGSTTGSSGGGGGGGAGGGGGGGGAGGAGGSTTGGTTGSTTGGTTGSTTGGTTGSTTGGTTGSTTGGTTGSTTGGSTTGGTTGSTTGGVTVPRIGGVLSRTGANVARYAAVAFMLLAAGAALTIAGRRRRTAHQLGA